MNLVNYHMIISDLDGTLVEYGSNIITSKLRQNIFALRKKGILFTFATGRDWEMTKSLVKECEIKIPVIVQSGAMIVDPVTEAIVRLQPLGNGINKRLKSLIMNDYTDVFVLAADGAYYTSKISTPGGQWVLKTIAKSYLAAPEDFPSSVVKYLFVGNKDYVNYIIQKIRENVKPKPALILWPPRETEDWFLEVFDPAASKGRALKWISKQLRIPLKKVLAFGDGHNDLELFDYCGSAIAMEHSPSNLLEKANFTIPGPEAEGMARFLAGEIEPTWL